MKLCLCVLYTALQVTVGCIISEPKHETITRSPGESVLLPCSCTDLQTKPDEIHWTGPSENKKSYKLTGDLNPEEKKRYSGRVQTFSDSSPGNASLLLSDLTEEDQGDYSCEIESNKKGGFRLITLIIKGEEPGEVCTLSEPEEETITRSPGESVLLSCSCTDLQTKPDRIRWSVTSDKIPYYELTGELHEDEIKYYTSRVQTFSDSSPGNASLLLSHLTEEDQGYYFCEISSKSGGMRTITLTIERSKAESGAGLSSIVLLMIIILLVGVLGTAAVLYWRYRKRNEPSESRGEHSGQEQQDVTYSTVVHGSTARAALRDPNTEETTEYAIVRVDGDVTYSTVDHGNRASPPPEEINTEEVTEYSSIRLDRV